MNSVLSVITGGDGLVRMRFSVVLSAIDEDCGRLTVVVVIVALENVWLSSKTSSRLG